VVNFNGNTVQGYMIDGATGTPSGAAGAFATGTGTGPTCVAIDPALGDFLYTSNSLDNTVTGERLNPNTAGCRGPELSVQRLGQPSCLTVVPNGRTQRRPSFRKSCIRPDSTTQKSLRDGAFLRCGNYRAEDGRRRRRALRAGSSTR